MIWLCLLIFGLGCMAAAWTLGRFSWMRDVEDYPSWEDSDGMGT